MGRCAVVVVVGVVVGSLLVAAPRDAAAAEPAVLYVPDEDVEIHPAGVGVCGGIGGQDHSALGCDDVPMTTVVPAYPDAPGLRASLAMSLAPYDVHLADERPPDYLPYTMLLASDDPEPRSESFTCSRGGINCGARKRNDIVWVFGPTQNCPVSHPLLTSLYAFGRASGLEGTVVPFAAMHYVPDYSGPGLYLDGCSFIVNQIGFDAGGAPIELPLECPSVDHEGCASGQQNEHVELLARYGPRVVDEDPPVLQNLVPVDGTVIARGGTLTLDVDIIDADPVLGGRWTITSPALADAGIENGVLTMCTNDVCFVNWNDANPLKATDSDWAFQLDGIPEGEYQIAFEASDFHGNVTQTPVVVVAVGDVPPPPPTTSTTGADTGDTLTSGVTSLDSGGPGPGSDPTNDPGGVTLDGTSGPSGTAEEDGGLDGDGLIDHGCACRGTSGGRGGSGPWAAWLVVVAAARRRRHGPDRAGPQSVRR